MTSQLRDWLSEQSQHGTVDSEGYFSVRAERAWEKLGAFQLPFAEAWVLKLIQAGVGLNAGKIVVRQSWDETHFQFLNCQTISHKDVEDAVFELPQHLATALAHLGTAVRGLAKGTNQPFSLTYGPEGACFWNGSYFSEKRISAPSNQGFALTVSHFSLSDSSSAWSLSSETMREKMTSIYQALCHHCYTCPVELLVDGRAINGIHNDPVFGVRAASQPIALVTSADDSDLPAYKLLLSREWRWRPTSPFRVKFPVRSQARTDQSLDVSALGILTAFLYQPNNRVFGLRPEKAQLVWLKDGVVVDREVLDFKGEVSFAILASAHGLETDLTGLKLRQSPDYHARRKAALSALAPSVRKQSGQWAIVPLVVEAGFSGSLSQFLKDLWVSFKPFFDRIGWRGLQFSRGRLESFELELRESFILACGALESYAE